MADVRTFSRSFAGGEITPELFGRLDLAGFQTGLASCRNFEVLPHGPVANRPGFAFVREVQDSTKATRVIPFSYSTTQTMVLEFGDLYIRFHTAGATLESSPGVPYEVVTPYVAADLFDIHYVQSADVLTLVHPNYEPRELRRLGALSWTLTAISFAAPISPPTSTSIRVTTNGVGALDYFYQYVITCVTSDGGESAASDPGIGVVKTITAVTQANPGVLTTSASHVLSVGDSVYIRNVEGMTELNNNYYVVDTVPTADTLTLKDTAGNVVDTTAFTAYTSGGDIYRAGAKHNLATAGAANTITWTAVADASSYNVYKFQGGLFGYIGKTSGTTFVDDNIAPDLSRTPPIYTDTFTGAGNYPAAVSYYEQRRDFGGTTNKPQNLWMTRSGTESNLSSSLPTVDEDAISFRIAAREANTIRHIAPLSDLILLTSSAAWRVTSVNSDAITPTSVQVRPQSHIGASNVQPVMTGNALLYAQARGGRMRELVYSQDSQGRVGYTNTDVSIQAPHLFDFKTIVDMAFAHTPYPILWAVSSDGKLLGMTYVPEQKVAGWHKHDTDGTFESVCIVAEGDEDALYAIVKRNIDGSDVRYVERMHTRQFAALEDAFFVDSGLTYDGAAATTITGLDHLEGETVAILADGAVLPQQVVSGGSITLDEAASKVHVGLPITADIETLPLATEAVSAFGQGRVKNVNKVWLRVYRSSGVFAGPDSDTLRQYKQRRTEPYGSPPDLIEEEEIEIAVDGRWGRSGQVFVRQSDPLPLTITSMTVEAAIGG